MSRGYERFHHGGPGGHTDPKAMRSIFIANVAFETTEEQLRSVLSEVGPVVNIKLVQDPATGRPKGFGFCEYEDSETALSACRNLTGRELNGRSLRIDSAMNAPGDSTRPLIGGGNVGNVIHGPVNPPLHGEPVPPEGAPEAITKAVASLPPEQMFELMKQMKWCIQHNPKETRQLLLNNPQLAYALLQAQVVMKIVDLETAQNILHRTTKPLPPLLEAEPPYRGPQGRLAGKYHDPHPQRGRRSPFVPTPVEEPDTREDLLMQVLSLTKEQIDLLPVDQRNNILRLKQQLAQQQ